MKIWFDTEFLEDGKTIKLISIGMVREDGERLYMEAPEAEYLAGSDPWLKANVLPNLRGGPHIFSRDQMAAHIQIFAGPKPEFWAYYASYDWVALCQLYGRMIDLPDGFPMFVRDLQQAIMLSGRGKPPEQTHGTHDALEDALWTRDAWTWLHDSTFGGAGILTSLTGPGFKPLSADPATTATEA
ncbi:3'-5' exoribonuclease [Methylobacterium brachiatum]|uniref:3'-5' exoribonuclease n=1 Tax=Methylobacterium brachiatum TaxID=269660 RepID=UPI0008E0DFDC|nr:3'-5' exoribonuclease [Methylobacterium brachiatum]SFJ68488.1 protein of unknown function [Methylobacterium brachiatum]